MRFFTPTCRCSGPALYGQGLTTTATKDDWEEINFEFNSSILSDGYPSLLRIADLLSKNPSFRVRVDGNTDNVGSTKYNDKLAQHRAETVKAFLVKYGAGANQIEIASHGKNQPKVQNRTKEGRFINRRVSLTVLDANGKAISAGGAAEAIQAMAGQAGKQQAADALCCSDVLKKLDKLDDILAALKQLNDANAGLKREIDSLRSAQAALKQQVEGQPKPLTKPEVADITRAAATDAIEQSRDKRFSLLGMNIGADDRRELTFTGKARFFAPFKDKFAIQSEAEYMYYRDRKEGQFDLGLVNRFHKRAQAGLFASFKHITLDGMQSGGTLGQGSFTLDYLFGRGRLGVFGSKGFMNDAVVNRETLSRNSFIETYLHTVDQIGASTTLGLFGRTYMEANLGYLKGRGGADRPGGTMRFIHPVSEHVAVTLEGGMNETLLGRNNNGRVVAGVMFGSFLRPKDYLGVDHPVPADIPRVRYELLTRRVRTGNDPPVVDAGPDQVGVPAGTISLDGSASFDPDGDPITFQWSQIAGPAVSLNGAMSSKASFTAAESQNYSFRLTAKDDKGAQGIGRVTVSTQASPDVTIGLFVANPPSIQQGRSSTLSWKVLNADTVEISGISSVAGEGTSSVSPRETTTYKLTAKNRRGEKSETVTVVVERPQATLLMCQASPTNILEGESSTLYWKSENAEEVRIEPNVGRVAESGTATVSPTVSTNYTITARNANGSTSCSVGVQVTKGSVPRIVRFTAAPPSIFAGDKATLLWAVENATEVSISGVGKVDRTGSTDVTPTQTTSYTLTAKNASGEVTATSTVTVQPGVGIAACTASPSTTANPYARVALNWSAQNASDVSISGIGSVGLTGPAYVQPAADTTYTITATGRNGAQATCQVSVKVTPPAVPGGGGTTPTDNPPRAAIAGGGTIETIVRQIRLDGSGSSSALNLPLTYRWTTRSSTASVLDPSSATPTVQLGQLYGDYFFDLVVTDSRGVSSPVATVVVKLVVTRVQ